MPLPLVQSAINVSEGRNSETVQAIVAAVQSIDGATVADWSADPDHNRMVVTLLGPPAAVGEAAIRVAREAVNRIDLRRHVGAHPRLGAVDVIPFVPVRAVTIRDCVDLSVRVADILGRDLALPIFLYEHSAQPGREAALPDIRRGGFEGLFTGPLEGARLPDCGPSIPHPTAGACVVGARGPLVAYNVNLGSDSVSPARRVAARIRAARAANATLAGVRTLGMWLESRRMAQVSMNLTAPSATTLPAVFDFVQAAAAEEGTEAVESEVIGLAPQACLGGQPPSKIRWDEFRESQILEYWMERL